MTTIGTAVLQVIPSLDGVSAAVDKQLGGTLSAAGKKGGKDFSKGVGEGLKDLERAVESAGDAYKKLQDKAADALGKVRTEEAKLQELTDKGITDGPRRVAAEERLEAARRRSTQAGRDAERGLGDLNRAQDDLGRGSEKTGGILDGLGGKLGAVGVVAGGAALAGVAAFAAGAVLAGQQLYEMGAEFDDVFDNLRLKTGATGDGLQELANAAERLSTNVPLSISEIGNVVAETSRALHLTGPELDNTARAIANLGRLTDENVDIRELGKAFRGFGIDAKDQVPALDSLFRATQATGLPVNTLLASVVKGGAALREFGLDIGESAGLMATFEEAGLDGEKAIAGMTKAFAYFSKEGLDPQQGLKDVTDEIQRLVTAGDQAAAADLTNKVFGAKNGVNFFDIIKSGDLDLQSLNDAIANTGETIAGAAEDTDDWAERWQTFKNGIEVGLQPIATGVFDAVNGKLTELADWVDNHKVDVIEFFGDIGDYALEGFSKIVSFSSGSLRAIGEFVKGLGDAYKPTFDQLAIVGTVIEKLTGDSSLRTLGEAGQAITSGFQEVPDILNGAADGLDSINRQIPGLQDGWDGIIDRTADATRFTEALGDVTASIPDGKEIKLSDNSPEVIENLHDLGIAVLTTPSGITVTATTEEGQRVIDAFRAQQTGAPLELDVKPTQSSLDQWRNLILGGPTPPGAPPAPGEVNSPATNWQELILPPRADGGIFKSLAFGKMPTDAIIQPATEGLVQWAEPSTGGEAFIPLNGGQRSLDIWAETGRRLMKFETGGFRGLDVDAAEQFVGTPYSQGNRNDCSGMVARVINAALGQDGGGLMTTKTAAEWLAARGFVEGMGGPGQISVGWYDRGPNTNDGHMAMTLSDGRPAEAGGSHGEFLVGSGAAGANSAQFDHHMYLPAAFGEGNSSSPFAGGSAVAAMNGQDPGAATSDVSGEGAPTSGSGVSLPSSLSDMAGFGLSGLGSGVGATSSGSDLGLFTQAAGSAVSGQVSSALGVLGVGDAPGWLKGISTFVSGISVGGQGSAGSAAPVSASPTNTGTLAPDSETTHGSRAGQPAGPVFNTTIQARDAEGALEQWRRWQNERVATKTTRY